MNIIKTLHRDASAQFRVSHNLKESLPLKCCRAFWAAFYMLKALRTACRFMSKECLGSSVIYGGRRCYVSNWAGSESPTLAADGFYQQHCDRSKIKNVLSVREIAHRFGYGFSFYMGNHYGNDIQRRLYK